MEKDGLRALFAATVYSVDVGHAKPRQEPFQTALDATKTYEFTIRFGEETSSARTEMFFLVEKMESLVAQQRDVRMLRKKIVDRGCACFLRTGDDKVHPVDLSALKASDGRQRGCRTLPFSLVRFYL